MARARYVSPDDVSRVLVRLTSDNAKVVCICACTGLRVGDVVELTWNEFDDGRKVESKTGKVHEFTLPDIVKIMMPRRGRWTDYIFDGSGKLHHRTRQAVNKDLRRACREVGVPVFSPHSLRKMWAVDAFEKSNGDVSFVQRLMNHDYLSTTLLYVFSDKIK